MLVATIVIDSGNPSNVEVCDDLLEHALVVADIGTRPTKFRRVKEIEDELGRRVGIWGDADVSVQFLTIFVEPGRYDFDVLGYEPSLSSNVVHGAVNKAVAEWRAKGEPERFTTFFEYEAYEDGIEDE